MIDAPDRRLRSNRVERGDFRAGEPDLRSTLSQPVKQCLAPQGVEVSGHFVQQEQARAVGIQKPGMGEVIDQLVAQSPLKRIGQPEEIGAAVMWLCGEDASFVHGQAIVVDGAITSR